MYNHAMRRNTVRSLSHVRDFVASAFFREGKRRRGAAQRDRGAEVPAKCLKRAKYYIPVVADWTT